MTQKYKIRVIMTLLTIMLLTLANGKTFALMDDTNRNFKSITLEDGLSQGSVLSIMQDSNGYMWLGTADGLNKYNGNNFKVYKSIDNDENSISGNTIIDIEEDIEGNIWVGSTTGLSKINTETDKITTYLPNKDGCKISHFRIRDILMTKNGEVLVGTGDGLNKYSKENDNFERVYNFKSEEHSLSNQEIYSLEEDINGDYWIGTKHGLNKINNKTGKIEKYFTDENDKNSISHNFIYSLHADEVGYLWIGTYYGGLNKLNLKTGRIEKFMPKDEKSIPGSFIRKVLRDSRGYVWIATDYGFAKLNEENNTFTNYNSNKYNSGSLLSNDIKTLYEDRTGNIWIGSMGGINLFNPENLFNYYKPNPLDKNSLSSELISGIYEDDDGLLWIGTISDGLNIFDRKNNKITRVDSKKEEDEELTISNNLVRSITGRDNKIFIATESGLNIFNKDTLKMEVYKSEEGLGCFDIRSLFIDKEDTLWIGTRNGIYTLDKQNNVTDHSKLFRDEDIQVLNISDIHEDKDGLIWIACDAEYGLISFNKESKEIRTYNYFEENEEYNIKKYYTILSIDSDSKGNVWIGTDIGLIKLNKKMGNFKTYTESDGLPNSFIYGTLLENDEVIWISTNYGISKFNVNEEKFINYDSTDGLQGNEFNEYSYFKSKSGEMFFGGTNGLTSFYPDKIIEKAFTAKVEIESISSNFGNLDVNNKIGLDYRNNSLRFEFFVPDYSDTRKVKYAYKLIGLDKQWTISSEVHSASYSNLEPGNYVFQVAARNTSGEWSTPTSVSIRIKNPPWKTPLAYLVYLFVGISIIYLIWNRVKILDRLVQQKTNELNHKLDENKELYMRLLKQEKYKNNYFINLSHELRTPLNIVLATQNLITNLNEQNKVISKDKMNYYMQTINRNCKRLINLIDNIMDTSKIESGSYKLKIKENDIVYLVEEVALSMKELAYDKNIELIIEPYIEEKIIECDAIEIERVIINLISNAIKFTHEGGCIEVNIWDLQKFIKISVKDNGIGIASKNHLNVFDRFSQAYSDTSEEYEGSGLGLTLSKQLIELHKGSIWVKSELGNGSEFIILLPVKYDNV